MKFGKSSKVSLRYVLIVPFVFEIILITGLVALISYQNGQRSVEDVVRQLRSEAAENILIHLEGFLERPHLANAANASLIYRGLLDTSDVELMERHLFDQVSILDSLSSIYFANEQGGLVDAGREGGGGDLYIINTEELSSGVFRKYAVDEWGNHMDLLQTVPDFDARTRPWYTGAVEQGGATWSDVYILFTGQDMAISASQPVYDEDGSLLGVLSSDIFLTQINEYLSGMDIGEHGIAYIFERSGELIASSTETPLFIEDHEGQEHQRLLAQESSDPLISRTAESILSELESSIIPGQSHQYDLMLDREKYYIQVSSITDEYGIDWLAAVVIPESDFIGRIIVSNRITSGLVILSVVVAVVMGILTARYVTDPVLDFNQAASAIADGKLDITTGPHWILEIDQLAASYRYMVDRLSESQQAVSLEMEERKQVEKALRKQVSYEEGLAAGSRILLDDEPDSLERALKALQNALKVSGVSLYRVDRRGSDLCMERVASAAESVRVIEGERTEDCIPYGTISGDMRAAFASGRHFGGKVKDFPGTFRALLEKEQVLSFLALPIRRGKHLYGFLGFDDRVCDRDWQEDDIRMITAAAGVIGSYLEQVDVEQALLEKTAEQETLLDTMHAQVWYLMSPGTYGMANRAHAEFYGLEQMQMRFRNIEDFFSPEVAVEFVRDNEQVFGSREIVQYEKWVRNAAGEERMLVVTKTPSLDEYGEVRHVVCVATDETERVLMEQQMRQQDRLAAVGQLAAGVAHDFNNIITSIVLYTQMSLQDTALTAKLRERMVVIEDQADRAADLVQQILDFGRRTVLEYEPIEVGKKLAEICGLLERTLPESIQVEYNIVARRACVIKADPTRFQQVILNLALNSRDAMPEGGSLCFELSENDDSPIECDVCGSITGGSWAVIEVSDTGSGIPPEVLPKVLEPFFTTKAPNGHGLGLAQVYGILKQHGGHLSLKSEPGEGTRVILYWPMTDLMPEPEDDHESKTVHGSGELILVVEDNEPMRNALVDVLALLGYRTLQAADGNEGLKVCAEHGEEIRLVISDWVMPGMGGRTLAANMEKRWPAVKILLLTGHPLQGDVREGLPKNIEGFLMKPPSLEVLAEEIKRVLNINPD